MGKLRPLTFPVSYKPSMSFWALLGLVCLMLLSTETSIAGPRPLSKSYVSARPYWYYLQSVDAWMTGDFDKSVEFMRVALVYDPGNTHMRSRWAQLEWGQGTSLSPTRFRRYIRRAPDKPALYRLLALEYWRRGLMKEASQSFRRSLQRLRKASPTEQKILVRDFTFFLMSKGAFAQALRLLRRYERSTGVLLDLKQKVIAYQESVKTPVCSQELDSEHTCRSGFVRDVNHAEYKKPMSWADSLDWGLIVLDAKAACGAGGPEEICRVFEPTLRRLALPLNSLQKEDLF